MGRPAATREPSPRAEITAVRTRPRGIAGCLNTHGALYPFRVSGYLVFNMPSARTMLDSYQRQVHATRGAGMAGLGEQARLTPTIRALIEVVNEDYDPRGPNAARA